MFFKKSKVKSEDSRNNKVVSKEQIASKETSHLLERYLQKNMTDHMRNVDDEALAKAIQTLLYEDEKKKKHLN